MKMGYSQVIIAFVSVGFIYQFGEGEFLRFVPNWDQHLFTGQYITESENEYQHHDAYTIGITDLHELSKSLCQQNTP